ncbi:phosphoribosyl-AMP cyclohydrolase [Mesosutterella sp. OilRF-GAM-744-9]|uniref:Phosphoribosyl-AMP cyclohydrolase n=1 Tax=Mesosutterella porci TaxID=2915351 RepID=A0ABS9MR28_9BURK|nr:phosphoribosyl-AMP cyclohydrolase [Mesosutterella sp. oilRF-744-WT-GAM-9]MCG5031081.1 phosphoribosyl-AMP cyclohydrolase [Mesosutterella sp. oilRF-744-WT-GAM-9]MCI6531292.1 phosphoribosyl-AMP cyclohydrolase [Mesosutterella sp.]
MSWLDDIRFDSRGLVPVIAQERASGRVMMLAWADRQAVEETARTHRGVYYSRSRSRLWRKGEESGNVQNVFGIYLDCDGDALVYEIEQVGGVACHTGHASCFFRRLAEQDGGLRWVEDSPVLKDPEEMYHHRPKGE